MKVLHVGKFFYPHKGGLEFYMRDTLVEFSRRGHECAALVHQHEAGEGDADEVFREGGAAVRVVRARVQFNLLFTPFSRSFRRLLERLLGYRVFPDADGRMNLGLGAVGGGLLLVPQFTLAADTRSGMRPGFSTAAGPDEGRRLFDYLVRQAQMRHAQVQSGRFGADMQVSLLNDGPVTFWLEVNPGH